MIPARFICYPLLLLLAACNSHIPARIQTPPARDIEYQEVKRDVKSFRDQSVRWGGKIISIENKEDSTWIEILSNPLNSYGRPVSSGYYRGRFIARVDGFLDPEHYAKDRYITVFGKVETRLVRQIDEHPYDYPLIHAQEYHLWAGYRRPHYHYPYYYGYYPHRRFYYPYYRYPYSRFRFGYHHRHYW
ncbi:MAG: Slp family lipoprotein [Pirellulales bacterium]|nr:Slp family lipoprotein [Pirellulales bacterium]